MPARRAHALAERGVDHQLLYGRCQSHGVVEGDEQSGLSLGDDLAAAADVGGDHRQAAGRRLHGRSGEALTVRRQHEEVEGRVDVLHVDPATDEDDAPAAAGGGELLGGDAVGLVGIGSTDDDEHDVGVRLAETFSSHKELTEALLPHETRNRPHHHGVAVDAEVGPGLSATALVCSGTEALQIDAVAEQHQLVTRHAQTGQHLKILGILDQLGSRAQRGRPLQGVDHGLPRRPILRAGIEAMHRVDHAGHPSGAGSDPSVEARLGVVGVDDVGPKPSEELPQLDERHDVLADRRGPGGMSEGLVADTPRFQLGYERAGSRHPDYFHAGLGESSELRAQQ